MIVYNITTKLTWQIAEDWLLWQKETHIPEMMATGLFSDYRIFRLLEQDEEEGLTFTLQFFIDSPEKYEEYIRVFAPALRQKAITRWGHQSIAFRTVMELVN